MFWHVASLLGSYVVFWQDQQRFFLQRLSFLAMAFLSEQGDVCK
jgi:hypothetical protein